MEAKERKISKKYSPEFKISVILDIAKLEEYIFFYNNKRVSLKLKMSPVQYRTHGNVKKSV